MPGAGTGQSDGRWGGYRLECCAHCGEEPGIFLTGVNYFIHCRRCGLHCQTVGDIDRISRVWNAQMIWRKQRCAPAV